MSPAEAHTSERPVRRQGPVRVLVVDDEPDTVMTLLAILRDEGYEALGFSHPLEALKALREFDPDVVISDIAMPVMSGWELARKVREKMGEGRPVMIAISGVYRKSVDKLLASTSGYAFFLAKPCDPGVVVTLIEKALESGQA
jgi:CheY-like chemotaxis protein